MTDNLMTAEERAASYVQRLKDAHRAKEREEQEAKERKEREDKERYRLNALAILPPEAKCLIVYYTDRVRYNEHIYFQFDVPGHSSIYARMSPGKDHTKLVWYLFHNSCGFTYTESLTNALILSEHTDERDKA